jgi:hypothetical protein
MNDAVPPDHNQMPSERFRLSAKDWVEKDGAARMLEEAKTAVLAQKMKALGDMPAAHAEREVKASEEWSDYIKKMVETRTAANLAKVRTEYLKMKVMEWQAMNANRRAEMRLTT